MTGHADDAPARVLEAFASLDVVLPSPRLAMVAALVLDRDAKVRIREIGMQHQASSDGHRMTDDRFGESGGDDDEAQERLHPRCGPHANLLERPPRRAHHGIGETDAASLRAAGVW